MNSLSLNSILLVDDDEISNLFNKIFIEKLNMEVEVDVALNGEDALAFLNRSSGQISDPSVIVPCLLLLDIKMPKMNGWEFMKVYEQRVDKSIRDNIIIVMLTTSQDENDAVKALKNPYIKEFIQKPLSEEKVESLVSQYFSEPSVL